VLEGAKHACLITNFPNAPLVLKQKSTNRQTSAWTNGHQPTGEA